MAAAAGRVMIDLDERDSLRERTSYRSLPINMRVFNFIK